ncbi:MULTISPECIES: ATP-binding cassette domain-containing protein [Thiorhodovibrio]|uniref:ATP-binding cassette domain-containing protein n=1 Tax=Thiorhodovibrio TaxID=61593 RepID=UPI0019142483|nr:MULTISPECIES: ATP-binding cassette domain-containing protein [Thiorhodovibrio]MBK5969269.1 hypothetical protein [Thiorhodovibrio winogradskyi]WPL11260.1 ABC transporter ATP-binding protein YojI [Thiorhodovibrio litoralis]
MIEYLLTSTIRRTLRALIRVNLLMGLAWLVLLFATMAALDATQADGRIALIYLLVALILVVFGRWHSMLSARFAIDIITQTNVRIAECLLRLSFADYERLDRPALLALISEDSRLALDGLYAITGFIALFMLQMAFLLYLAFLSPGLFLLSVGFLGTIYLAVFWLMYRILRMEDAISKMDGRLYRGLSGQLFGFKELRLHQPKQRAFMQTEIEPPIRQMQGERTREKFFLSLLFLISDSALLLFAGIFIVFVPLFVPDMAKLAARSGLVVLFFPMAMFMELPTVSRAAFAFGRLDTALRRLENLAARNAIPQADTDAQAWPSGAPPTLRAEGLAYQYPDHGGEAGFAFGPMDLTIEPGTITFLVGGNGSGKSTCLKLLIGLYQPSNGTLLLDERPVDMAGYRRLFATVFVDSYLFQHVLGVGELDEGRVNRLLDTWGIGHKTRFQRGRFTNIDLSTGQKKRVAMVAALLEDKPFLVLDEWAADQAPEFRAWFYQHFLPEMRALGKTIVVASHDEQFFAIADQVLVFEDGRLRGSQPPAHIATH